MNHKVISMLLIVMMLFGIATPALANSSSVTVEAESVNGKAGDTVTVGLKLTKNTGFSVLTIAATYDTDALEFVEAVNKVDKKLEIEDTTLDNTVRLFIEEPNEKNYTGKNVALAELVFKVKKTCAAGTYRIALNGYDDQIDADLNDVRLTLVNGSVVVKQGPQQDDNGVSDSKTEDSKVARNAIVLTIGKRIVSVGGKQVMCDVPPLIVEGRTYTPARFVAEQLGANVAWNPAKQLVKVTKDDIVIEMTIGSELAKVNGKTVKMGAKAFIKDGRTYTPARFVAEQLGADVNWNKTTRQVTIIPETNA